MFTMKILLVVTVLLAGGPPRCHHACPAKPSQLMMAEGSFVSVVGNAGVVFSTPDFKGRLVRGRYLVVATLDDRRCESRTIHLRRPTYLRLYCQIK